MSMYVTQENVDACLILFQLVYITDFYSYVVTGLLRYLLTDLLRNNNDYLLGNNVKLFYNCCTFCCHRAAEYKLSLHSHVASISNKRFELLLTEQLYFQHVTQNLGCLRLRLELSTNCNEYNDIRFS